MTFFGSGEKPSEWPRSHHEMVRFHRDKYYHAIRSGEARPFLYPWGTLGAAVGITFLLIPHQNRPWLKKLRFLAFAWMAGFAMYSTVYTRARTMAPSLGLGLISIWSIYWAFAILVVNDAQTDFQRIERTEGVFKMVSKTGVPRTGIANISKSQKPHSNGSVTNGHAMHEDLGLSERHGDFAWQPYPITPFIERLDWVLDIFCNFRGTGWNWRTSSQPPPPKDIMEQLNRSSSNAPRHHASVHATQPRVYITRRALLIANLKTLLAGYIVLDALKTIMNHDPYFWGIIERNPSAFPPFLRDSPVLLRIYRLTLSQIGIKWALQTIFSLGPLFFSGLLGPSILGARAEPWIYPETWGPYSAVFERGLAGWWSGWWHQTFRFAFQEPSRKIIEIWGMDKRGTGAKVLQLVVAFGMSGCFHAAATYTSNGGLTRPLNTLLFFLLQALAIVAEVFVSREMRKIGVNRWVPDWVAKSFTFLYVHVWFYFSGPLLCDDFSRGGVWLLEPIPVSPLRGLGLGVEGDGWWCWGGDWVKWESGDNWWNFGLSI